MGCCDRSTVFHEQYSSSMWKQMLDRRGQSQNTSKIKQKKNRDVEQLLNVDNFPANAHSSQGKSQLCMFEDNEAVIKMIIEGRSPTVRHVARTHRVAVDWLFDRRNLDPKILIKYVDTKEKTASGHFD